MNKQLPHSEACERNQQVIFNELKLYLDNPQQVLEIGSGTGQHGEYFASQLPQIEWQLSDREEYLAGLDMRWQHAELRNLHAPKHIDVNTDRWLDKPCQYGAIYTANTLHIMDRVTGENFLDGASQYTVNQGFLFIYGPFKYAGEFTSLSNQAFDASLKARQYGDGIKDFEWLETILTAKKYVLLRDIAMPANNQLLIWKLTDK